MTFPLALTPPIAGALAFRSYPGFGILGADIQTEGDNGGSPVLNDGISPTAEYHWRVETAPSDGVLTIYPDLTFDWDSGGVADGQYPWVYRLFENGSDEGTATVQQQAGSPVGAFAFTTDELSVSTSASVSPIAAFAITTGEASFSGGAAVSPLAAFAASTDEIVFVGGGSVAGTPASCSFAFTTDSATFSGGARVSPVAALSSVLDDLVFSGGAVAGISEGAYALTLDSFAFSGGASGYVPQLTLTQADIDAIVSAIMAHPQTLTVSKYLALK